MYCFDRLHGVRGTCVLCGSDFEDLNVLPVGEHAIPRAEDGHRHNPRLKRRRQNDIASDDDDDDDEEEDEEEDEVAEGSLQVGEPHLVYGEDIMFEADVFRSQRRVRRDAAREREARGLPPLPIQLEYTDVELNKRAEERWAREAQEKRDRQALLKREQQSPVQAGPVSRVFSNSSANISPAALKNRRP
jgi:hypothetical protein